MIAPGSAPETTASVRPTLSTTRTFLIILFLGLFALAARNVTDPDVWWHLKTGQYIAEHDAVPHTDPFSYTFAGKPWVAHEWLTELLLYEYQRIAGWGGLIVFFAAIECAAFLLLYLRCGPDPYVAGVASLYAAWATIPVWGVRPQVISLFLTSLWLLILERSESSARLLWWTLPLTLLWVNLHAGFALGLALSVLFIVGEGIECALSRSSPSKHMRTALIILLLDLLLVPFNPNGLRLFSYPLETLRSAAMKNYIAEWASPNFHHADYWPFLLVVLITFAVLGSSRLPLRPRDLLLLLVGLYAGLGSIRMMPVFILIAVPLMSKRLGNFPSFNPRSRTKLRTPAPSQNVLNISIVLVMAIFAAVHTAQIVRRQPQVEADRFPARAVAFLQTHPPSGPVFNHYDWGGYLIWKLYPSARVFIDGRADLYGEQFLNDFANSYQLKKGWQEPLQRWNIETAIVPPDSALAQGLQNLPGWTVVYEDKHAIVLKDESQPVHSSAMQLPPNARNYTQ